MINVTDQYSLWLFMHLSVAADYSSFATDMDKILKQRVNGMDAVLQFF